jgi:hypothetical protein
VVFSEDIAINHDSHELTIHGHKTGSGTREGESPHGKEVQTVSIEGVTHIEKVVHLDEPTN